MDASTSHWPAPTPKLPLDAKQLERRAVGLFILSLSLCLLFGTYWLDNITGSSFVSEWLYVLYTIPILVPVTAWFVIANWVGWQYFRYA